jgi:hypothetical protein
MPPEASIDRMIVYCADIGSVGRDNFGWARLPLEGDVLLGRRIDDLVAALAQDLSEDRPISIGFECPLWAPVPVASHQLGKGRPNEGSPSWSGGPGGSVLATGLVQVPWILRSLKGMRCQGTAGLDWEEFVHGAGGRLFIWGAFVSGASKAPLGPSSHGDDAEIGARAFVDALPDPVLMTEMWQPVGPIFSIAGAALLLTGWSSDPGSLHRASLVVRAVPVADA